MSWNVIWGITRRTKITDAKCWPITINTMTIANWKISIRPALILLAFLIPNTTGNELNPSFETPSTLLKSFMTAIPRPERL